MYVCTKTAASMPLHIKTKKNLSENLSAFGEEMLKFYIPKTRIDVVIAANKIKTMHKPNFLE